MPRRRVQRLHVPAVQHDGVLPVVGGELARRVRLAHGRQPARAVPARMCRPLARLLPQHSRPRAPRAWHTTGRHQSQARLALRQLPGIL